ncbi:MAG: hypothetical protein O7H39_02145 [Gammaproteobacteria bacterium]|nr:hypothetical protein [Gammaproteobacteria bacterium]
MPKLTIPVLLAVALSVIDSAEVRAGGFMDGVELSAVFESEQAIGTATGDLQKAEFILTPELGVDVTPSTRLAVIGRLRGGIVDNLEPGQPSQHNRSAFSKRLFVGDHVDVELREAYVDTEIGSAFLRIGKQQVVWGQADGLKLLDVLNPQSFREFILDDFEDSRIPLWTVNVEVPVGEAFLQLLWIPDKTYDDIPEPGAAFAFTSPLIVPELPPGVPVAVSLPERPDDFFADSDVGMKLGAFAGGWDLSLNYVYHYFDRPVVRREISTVGVAVRQDYERTHTLGGTFSNVFADITLRGEAAFSSDRFFLTDDLTDVDGVIRSAELSYVLGVDYQGWRDWFVSGQIFQSIVADPEPGLVRDRVDTTATFLVRRDFMNEALQAEVLVIRSLNGGDGLLQASVEYEWRTNVRLKVGAEFFYGNPQGLFGQFNDNDRVSIGIEVGF